MRIPMAVLYLPRVMLTKANFAFNETPIAFRAHVGDTVLFFFLCSFFLLFLFFSFTPIFCFISSYLVSRKKIPSVFFQTFFFFFILSTDPTSTLAFLLYSKFSFFSILFYHCKYIYGFMFVFCGFFFNAFLFCSVLFS